MLKRYGIILLLAIWIGGSGCASTARRSDGTPIAGAAAWNEPPAPPQRPAIVAADPPTSSVDLPPKSEGLAKYFPGLAKTTAKPPKAAAGYRPTWFGLRPKSNPSQIFTTDARADLNKRVGPEPTTLPVALQVPTQRASSDLAVTPANNQMTRTNPPSSRVFDVGEDKTEDKTNAIASYVPDFGGKPSNPGEDEVNPLPPAAERSTSALVANNPAASVTQMPEVPLVNPLVEANPSNPQSSVSDFETKVAAANFPVSEEKTAPTSPAPASESPNPASALPEPTIPVSYLARTTSATAQTAVPTEPTYPKWKPFSTSKVLPSPQATPSPQAKPSPQVKPTNQNVPSPQAKPTPQDKLTPQTKPSPQAAPSTQAKPSSQAKPSLQSENICSECGAYIKKRPCLRRLIRKVCKLGEYVEPPTAAPH